MPDDRKNHNGRAVNGVSHAVSFDVTAEDEAVMRLSAQRSAASWGNATLHTNIMFSTLIVLVWAAEIWGLPGRWLGQPPAPPEYAKALLLTAGILGNAVAVQIARQLIWRRMCQQIVQLDQLPVICSFCKKIRSGGEWVALEQYLHEQHELRMSHSLCPGCAKEHYGES